tara:strand:+ start:56 stop:385 length:330 start_codon:yes stop_codon:yes gene_type:complete
MYHTYISKDVKKIKNIVDFSKHKNIIKDIFDNMYQDNAENLYEYFYIYKDLFNEFTNTILELEYSIHSTIDISNEIIEYSDISKEIFYTVNKKKSNIIDIMKNKTIIYE